MKYLKRRKLQINKLKTQISKVKNQNHNSKLKTENIFLRLYTFLSPFYLYKISGDSMEPTIHCGSFAGVNRLAYIINKPKIGDVVAFRDPRDGKILIKRITDIKNDEYFVEGDNKSASTDSRKFGMISYKSIIGKLIS